jgi:KaiC/GvpD/RAD55 family RecA-like ATPase
VRTLARAVKRPEATGKPLPTVYPSLEAAGIRLRTGVVSMIVGEPGSYKSTFALNWLSLLAQQQVTSLYVSAEDDETIAATRVAAMMTDDPIEEVAKVIQEGKYDQVLKEISRYSSFEFRALDISQVADRMEAFRKAHGAMPQVLYIDNLMSMVEDPTDYHGQMAYLRDLAQIAATAPTPVAVLVLHHVREHPEKKTKNAPKPPARWEIHGKVSHFPKLILSIDTVGAEGAPGRHMGVAAVKNNYGPQDKNGIAYEDFWVIPECAKIVELV